MCERADWTWAPVQARTAALVVLLLILVLACDDRSPTSPTVGDMTGTWTGMSTYSMRERIGRNSCAPFLCPLGQCVSSPRRVGLRWSAAPGRS